MEEAGNSLKIVSTVYIAILLPWAFLYLHDFISDRWQTIRRTFCNGLLHLIAILLPLPYLLVYVYLQVALDEPDYKEMFAAITAVAFSLYHFLRTLWGLYQLHCFQKWAINVALTMESASYPCHLSRGAHQDPVTVPHKDDTKTWRSLLQKKGSSALSTMLKNRSNTNTKLKRPSSHGRKHQPATSRPKEQDLPTLDPKSLEAGLRHRVSTKVCVTHDINARTCPSLDSQSHHVDACSDQQRLSRICWAVNRMHVNSSIIDNEFINSYSPFKLAASSWRLHPLRRKSTLVRWIVLYLAHFGRKWLSDCRTRHFNEDSWTERRARLAARVWATAVLRMETDCHAALPNAQSASTSQGNFGATCFLDPGNWSKVTSSLDDQLFDRDFVLKECFLSGEGLPYNFPLLDKPDQPLPSSGLYRPLLKEAMETLPTRYFEEVENVTTEHIKWFVVFLNVKKWRGCVPDERQQPPSLPNQPEHRALQEKAPPSLGPTDTPVRLLQDQLGFHCQATTDRCGFPFATKGYGRHLWDNRSVLQVSARIDNWIALAVGRQIVNLLEDSKDQEDQEAKRISFETAHRRTPSRLSGLESQANQAVENESQANTDDDRSSTRSDSILTFHKKLELRRLRFQLANPNPQHSHLEVGLTFMGCVTESVRSGIAETLSRTEDNSAWSPVIPEEAVSFAISEQLMRSLGRAFFGQITTPFDSTLRERLLWECQNGVQWSWQNKQLNDRFRGPTKAQAEVIETMMLCILGFPSIHLLNHNSIRAIDKSRTANLVFEIWPTAAPQHLRIRLVVDCANSLMIAKIRECETGAAMATLSPTTGFLWQDWRDAFAGRLLGKRSWQKAHSMKELQVRRTTESISRGIQKIITAEDDGDRPVPVFRRQLVWGGWMPFRAGLTLFELKHSSLIILGDSMPTDTYSPTDGFSESTTAESEVQPQDKGTPQEISDTYQRASMSALTDASIHLDALLTLDTNLLDDGPGKPQDEDDDVAESQLVDLVPSASSSSDGQSFRMEFNFDPPLPASILAKASLQDPHAMHILAKWVLTGTKGFQKNYTKALLLMERALILGRNIMTARLLVKTLTDKTFMPDIPVDIDRALAAVELLWRDIAGRHEVVSIENKKVRRWKGDSEAELARLSKLVCMHQKLVQARPTAEMMRNLADHLSTWGESKPDEHAATVLYETAILASCDSKSILELGRRFHKRDPPFAAAMYQRALVAGQGVAAKLLADLLLSEKNNLRISPAQIADVYERAVRLGHVGAMRELGLLLLHGDDGVLANIVRGRHLAERAVYGDSIARALDSGAASLEIDSRLADQLRASARQAFGSPGGSASGHDTGPRGRS